MQKLPLYCVTLTCLLFFSNSLRAQTDYAITTKGDTIKGKMRRNLMGRLRLETADGKITVSPQDFSMYYDASKNTTYCSRVLPGEAEPTFVTRLINGAVRMYSYTIHYNTGNGSFSKTTWYAEKENIPINEIKAGGLRGGRDDRKFFFRSLIADNPVVVKKFDDDPSLDLSFMKALIIEYNSQIKTAGH